jgi:hypothetical protein
MNATGIFFIILCQYNKYALEMSAMGLSNAIIGLLC